MTNFSFRKDPRHSAAFASLTMEQRTAYFVFAGGATIPTLFMGMLWPAFWLLAIQLACVAGFAYVRWRSPAIRGSIIVLIVAVVASLVSLVAAVTA